MKVETRVTSYGEFDIVRKVIQSPEAKEAYSKKNNIKTYNIIIESLEKFPPKGFDFVFDVLNTNGSKNMIAMQGPIIIEEAGIVCGPKTPRSFWGIPNPLEINGKEYKSEIIDVIVQDDNINDALDEYNRIKNRGKEIREEMQKVINGPISRRLKDRLYSNDSAYLRGTFADKIRIPLENDDIDLIIISDKSISEDKRDRNRDRNHLEEDLEETLKIATDGKINFDIHAYREEEIKSFLNGNDTAIKYMYDTAELLFGGGI